MKKDFLKVGLISAVAVLPFVASAQGAFDTVTTIVHSVGTIVDVAIPIMFAIGILVFFYGLVKYIFGAGSEEQKVNGKNIMIWALVALFVMASVFGIIKLAQDTLDIQSGSGTFPVPDVERL